MSGQMGKKILAAYAYCGSPPLTYPDIMAESIPAPLLTK
jgi:hypothetical protein